MSNQTKMPFFVSCQDCRRLAVYADSEKDARQKAKASGFIPHLDVSVYRFDPHQIPAYCTSVINRQSAALSKAQGR